MSCIPTLVVLSFMQDFERVDPLCPQYVREAFVQLQELARQGESGNTILNVQFKFLSNFAYFFIM